jgi:PAS domain S-box-containing protein
MPLRLPLPETALPPVGVLLVEDDPDDLAALEAALAGPGLDLVRTPTAADALDRLRARDFAAVVVDLDTAGLDGFAFAQQVRSHPRTRETPLIFVSGGAAADFPVTAAYRLGVVDYLVKPVFADIFRAKVTTFADLFRKTERLRALDRREGDRRLAAADLRANTILESISDGFYALDRDWKFVYVNHRAEAYLGQPRADLIGRVLWDAVPVARGSAFEPEYRRAVASGRAVTVETRSPLTGRWIEAHAYPSAEGLSVYFRDVSDRRALQQTLEESEARLRSVTEAIPQLVWTACPGGGVDYCNRRWLNFTGLTADEARGAGWLVALHADDRTGAWDLWRHCSASGCDYEQEQRIRRADGAYVWFLTRATPLRDAAGRIERWYGTCTDIEDRVRAESELKQQDRRKDEFLATLAHELRNPLAPIRNAIEVLRLPARTPAATEQAVGVLDRQTRQLTRLVDDLLDVSRVSSGKLELRRSRTDLGAVVAAAVEASRPLVELRGHTLTVDLPPDLVWLEADAARLAQVLSNLLNNAAKYTEPGGRIRVTAVASPGGVEVAVSDTGVGLDADLLPNVFDAFVQADRSLSQSGGGLGLGLTLVRKLVEMHGGTVSAHSDGRGRGSRFTVRLPTADPPARPAPATAPSARPSAPGGRRVLIVEDNRDGAESLRVLLELVGHDVTLAHTGPDGVTAARAVCPEVVLCDLGLPGLSGYDVARALRADPTTADAVLVCVSGYGQERDRQQALDAGFDRALVKPVDPETLVRIVAGGGTE